MMSAFAMSTWPSISKWLGAITITAMIADGAPLPPPPSALRPPLADAAPGSAAAARAVASSLHPAAARFPVPSTAPT